ncbi:hypothetical protein LCGC14_0825530 [marine sediment metagenome]|uniref:Uncharacterized protein n=1 Tax=marine sediment metagenome TaxID=412755 RepID=A0A0F9SQ63_9ZZZZ
MEHEAVGILENPKDKEIFKSIEGMLTKFYPGHTRIQIENFILNDVEYPTKYGKYQQTLHELFSRYNNLIDAYYRLKEAEISLKWREADAKNNPETEKGQLAAVEAEKLRFQIVSIKASLKHILKETHVFYEVYQDSKEFHKLTPEQEYKLEANQWAMKALNNPLVFEERYGGKFLEQAWGKDNYKKFVAARKKAVGDLHREIVSLKVLPASTVSLLESTQKKER